MIQTNSFESRRTTAVREILTIKVLGGSKRNLRTSVMSLWHL